MADRIHPPDNVPSNPEAPVPPPVAPPDPQRPTPLRLITTVAIGAVAIAAMIWRVTS